MLKDICSSFIFPTILIIFYMLVGVGFVCSYIIPDIMADGTNVLFDTFLLSFLGIYIFTMLLCGVWICYSCMKQD